MKLILRNFCFLGSALSGVLIFCALAAGQSRDQNFPTSITANEVNGTIKARDIGDSRLTSYYYAFDGTQGDIFINVVTRNFSGDIDVFTKDTLRPLTKIVIYADSGVGETGRLIYLRKTESLLLRIQGRTPNDESATFRVKFGGSFVALKARVNELAPVGAAEPDRTDPIVNSVGTIIENRPKALSVKEMPPTIEKLPEVIRSEKGEKGAAVKAKETAPSQTRKSARVVIESTIKEPETAADLAEIPPPKTSRSSKTESNSKKKPDPLAGIRLILLMKDGTQIERPMTEVSKFSVDKGVLTVVSKRNGAIAKYSILDVARVTIE